MYQTETRPAVWPLFGVERMERLTPAVTRCFIDMDGVLCDFVSAIMRKEGIDPETFEWPEEHLGSWDLATVLGITEQEMWHDTWEPEFWLDLEKTPECDAIVERCLEQFGIDNVAILTSPSTSPGSNTGKLEWIRYYFPDLRKNVIMTSAKHLCASPSTVLIDDADHNCDAFYQAGGHTILVPRLWNERFEYADQTLDWVFQELSDLEEPVLYYHDELTTGTTSTYSRGL